MRDNVIPRRYLKILREGVNEKTGQNQQHPVTPWIPLPDP